MSVPLHYVVKTRLIELVEELGEGAGLPPERVLAKDFGVSRWTMRQAIRELIADGRLRARQGQGTFVATPKIVQPLALVSYTEALRAQGHTPAREVVKFDEIPASDVLAEQLAIAPGDPVFELERVLFADEQPIGLETTYLSVARFPTLREVLEPTGSLYRCLVGQLGVEFGEGEELLETVIASPREADLLKATQQLPMLLLHRQTRDSAGHPLEVVRSLYRGDRVGFRATLRP
ncbi:GntR family transcriptional regulator [Kribbella albertanoniae]|uniref:GntR family transcriptional regulator n=1 Tax=Kribbella albertanoniae TaxID=1266829 RepID=A0A4R4NXU8_9ACTN|nr:GntR family transcriptional regulator [Kribbella albertanoniae]TDC14688.1 GntR family transcriptional regulator [Kribbella albertanoniae]